MTWLIYLAIGLPAAIAIAVIVNCAVEVAQAMWELRQACRVLEQAQRDLDREAELGVARLEEWLSRQ